jgi:hypothetical protein
MINAKRIDYAHAEREKEETGDWRLEIDMF